jgi:predicted ester cyclase
MKRLLFAASVGLACFFVSCNNSPATTDNTKATDSVTTTTSSTAMADKNKQNTEAVFKGIETGDLSKMDDFVSKDAVDHGMGDVKGLDSIKKMLGDMHNHVNNLKMETITDASNGDYHFVMGKITGTTKDNWMGMAPNTSMDETFVGVEKITDGKVTEHWRFVDSRDVMKAMSGKKPAKGKM